MNVRHGIATFRGERHPRFDFIGRRRRWFLFSAILIALSLVGLFGRGLNFSIDFEGGAVLQYPLRTEVTADEVRRTLAAEEIEDAVVQVVEGEEVTVRTARLEPERQATVLARLADQAGISAGDISVSNVSPTWGGQISRKALQGLLIFLVLVSIYISFRFEWKMAVGAIAALVHDLLITAGVYGLVGREVTPATVIAILTILGYSLYDTVVIYDKIKENTENLGLVGREGYSSVVNSSLNQVFMRSMNTTITTLLPLGALLLFGGETLKDFAFALFVGIVLGGYSSLFVAAPVLAMLKEREPRYAQIRARLESRPGRAPRPVAVPADGETRQPVRVAAGGDGGEARGGARPRKPPAKKKPRRRRR